jgi:RNA polymerase sigma-70 factor (ECF subfamily)
LSTGYSGTGQSSGVVPGASSAAVAAPVGGLPLALAHERLDFEKVYDEHFDFVWRTARRMGIPEASADDVVQDVFLVVHRRLEDYDGHTPARRWVLGIVVRVVADHRRRFWRKDARCVPPEVDRDGAEMLPSPWPAPQEECEQAEALRLAMDLLEQLHPDKREVLWLAQVEQLSVPEIADCLGLNVNTVYARLRAARRDFNAVYARHRARELWRTP